MSSVQLHWSASPLIRPMPNTGEDGMYMLEEDAEYRYTYNGVEKIMTVPKGYLTDGASVPSALWRVIGTPYEPKFMAAAVAHDYIYEFQIKLGATVEEMSDLFMEILLIEDNGKLKSKLMRDGVAVFTTIFKYED